MGHYLISDDSRLVQVRLLDLAAYFDQYLLADWLKPLGMTTETNLATFALILGWAYNIFVRYNVVDMGQPGLTAKIIATGIFGFSGGVNTDAEVCAEFLQDIISQIFGIFPQLVPHVNIIKRQITKFTSFSELKIV